MNRDYESIREYAKSAVVLDDPSFRFNAMHFVTFKTQEGDWRSEPIHGHDFRAIVTIVGPLDESGCVVDFVAASAAIKTCLQEWEHKLILPFLPLDADVCKSDDELTTIDYNNSPNLHYVFPTSEIVEIEARNATTEEIAMSLLERIMCELYLTVKLDDRKQYAFRLRLEEAPGCFVEIEA